MSMIRKRESIEMTRVFNASRRNAWPRSDCAARIEPPDGSAPRPPPLSSAPFPTCPIFAPNLPLPPRRAALHSQIRLLPLFVAARKKWPRDGIVDSNVGANFSRKIFQFLSSLRVKGKYLARIKKGKVENKAVTRRWSKLVVSSRVGLFESITRCGKIF